MDYKTKCGRCKNSYMHEKRGNTVVSLGELDIMLIDAKFFYCEKCGSIAYRKSFGINEILLKAYENKYNVVIFEEEELNG